MSSSTRSKKSVAPTAVSAEKQSSSSRKGHKRDSETSQGNVDQSENKIQPESKTKKHKSSTVSGMFCTHASGVPHMCMFHFPQSFGHFIMCLESFGCVCMCICVFIEWWTPRLSRSTCANRWSTIDSKWTKSEVDQHLINDIDRQSTGRTRQLDGFFVCRCFTNVFLQGGHYSIKQETQWAPCMASVMPSPLPWSWDCFALQWSKVLTAHHSNHTTTHTITIITDWLHWKQLGIRSVLQWWTIPTLKPA